MIETTSISKIFWDAKKSEVHAVRPISLSIEKGEIFGILGPNGAGKTTLLRMIATVLKPSSGSACVNGFSLGQGDEGIKTSIGFLSGNTKPYGRLTPRELLSYFGELYDMDKKSIKARTGEIFGLLGMDDFADKQIEKLSTGQTQRVSIARCLIHDPPVYILDEPTLGLDILTSRTVIDFMKAESGRGKTILFSTHYLEEAESLCNRIALMHQGAVIDTDTMEGFREKTGKDRLRDVFLDKIQGTTDENE